MKDIALLLLRLVTGGLVAGHGAQKLFGWFGGHGLKGTANWLEGMGLEPGKPWSLAVALSEFGGGVLTALGMFHPIGPVAIVSSMSVATGTVHKDKPIWSTQGGAELAVTNIAVSTALGFAGAGKFSIDRLLGIRIPKWLLSIVLSGAAISATMAIVEEHESEQRQLQENREAPAGRV